MTTSASATASQPATATPHAARTAWVYIRESDEDSASGHGPDTQLRLCQELAAEKGIAIAQVAIEIKSAVNMSMKKRPIWRHVQRAALRQQFDALVVWEYSRIARNTADWLHFINQALNAGVEVYSTDAQEKQIDWHTPMGRAMLGFIGGLNEMEREKTRKRTMQGNQTRVLKGMPLVGTRPPYGYRWIEEASTTTLTGATRVRKVRLALDDADSQHPDAVTAARMRAIWDYLDTPDPLRNEGTCADWLNYVMRWPTPTAKEGRLWHRKTIRKLLDNGYYWGEGSAFNTVMTPVRVADSETGEYETEMRQRPRPHAERVALSTENVPPLIRPAQAMRVRAYCAEKRAAGNRTRHYAAMRQDGQPSGRPARQWNHDDFLLTDGLLRCGVCGHKLYATVKQGRASYRCMTGMQRPKGSTGSTGRHQLSVSRDMADAFAVAQTMQLLYTPSAADAAFARLAAVTSETDAELASAEAALAHTRAAIAAQKKLATVLTEDEVAEFAQVFRSLRTQEGEQAAKLAAMAARGQHVQSLAQTLAAAVQAARAETARLATAAERLAAGDVAGALRALPTETLVGLSENPNESGLLTVEAARSVAHFETARKREQRTVLRALGAHVTLLPDKDGLGTVMTARGPRRRYTPAGERLRYDLPLPTETSGTSGEAGDAGGHGHGHGAGATDTDTHTDNFHNGKFLSIRLLPYELPLTWSIVP